jgi:hypothetical protein
MAIHERLKHHQNFAAQIVTGAGIQQPLAIDEKGERVGAMDLHETYCNCGIIGRAAILLTRAIAKDQR